MIWKKPWKSFSTVLFLVYNSNHFTRFILSRVTQFAGNRLVSSFLPLYFPVPVHSTPDKVALRTLVSFHFLLFILSGFFHLEIRCSAAVFYSPMPAGNNLKRTPIYVCVSLASNAASAVSRVYKSWIIPPNNCSLSWRNSRV